MKNDFLSAIAQLAAEKNLPRDVVFEAVEAALTSAYRRDGENAPNIYVRIDPNMGDVRAYRQMSVVDEVEELLHADADPPREDVLGVGKAGGALLRHAGGEGSHGASRRSSPGRRTEVPAPECRSVLPLE